MRVLAIDTALSACAACVLESGETKALASEAMPLERGHAEALIPLISRVMSKVEGGFSGIDRLAVTVGPGSFTGLRVGLSAARAIGLVTGLPVVGVSTLAALCAPLLGREGGRAISAAIDARHGHVYFQALGPGGQLLCAPAQLELREAVRGANGLPLSLVGSGADLVAQEAWSIGVDAVVVNDRTAPDILWVARLGLLADPQDAPPRPLYLKAAEAKEQTNGRVARQ